MKSVAFTEFDITGRQLKCFLRFLLINKA